MPTDDSEIVRRRPRAAALTGLVAVLVLLVAVGWVVWQYAGTGVVARYAFDRETQQLHRRWQASGPDRSGDAIATAAPGTVVALLRVPVWGAGFEVPVVKGVRADDLAEGVGLYPGSVQPGDIGNLALAGNRVTYGSPFRRLADLDKGDLIVIETRTAIFTYALDLAPRDLTVPKDAAWVLDPVPGEPNAQATRALLTMTTAQDLFRSADRTVAFGHLVSAVTK